MSLQHLTNYLKNNLKDSIKLLSNTGLEIDNVKYITSYRSIYIASTREIIYSGDLEDYFENFSISPIDICNFTLNKINNVIR